MESAIRRAPPPLNGINFQILRSSYNWFKIDILRLLRPPTAIQQSCSQSSELLYIHNKKLTLCANAFWQSGSGSRWFLNICFSSKYPNSTRDPSHLHGKINLNFHFDYLNPLPYLLYIFLLFTAFYFTRFLFSPPTAAN